MRYGKDIKRELISILPQYKGKFLSHFTLCRLVDLKPDEKQSMSNAIQYLKRGGYISNPYKSHAKSRWLIL